MKKIIGLSLAALLITGVIGGATLALFSDTEVAVDNTLTAGTLNLQVGAADPCTESISVGPIVPTDNGNAADWDVINQGTITGTLRITFDATITNNENTLSEAEGDAGDVTGGATEGELGDFVDIAIWLDINENGTWDSGDKYLQSDGSVVDWAAAGTLPAAAYDTINNYAGEDWDSLDGMPSLVAAPGPGNEIDFMVEYDFPDDVNDDQAQSDSCVFDITFILEQ